MSKCSICVCRCCWSRFRLVFVCMFVVMKVLFGTFIVWCGRLVCSVMKLSCLGRVCVVVCIVCIVGIFRILVGMRVA